MSRAHPVPHLVSLGLPSEHPTSSVLLATPGLELTYNARGALLTAFQEIARGGKTKVLLPAYHCPSAVSPALMAGLIPVFYRVRRDLSLDAADVLSKADRDTAAILLIHFFGIEPEVQALTSLDELGVQRVEDCSHSYVAADTLRLAGSERSDYRIYSFWKIVPSGVGGGLWRRDQDARRHRPAAPAAARLRNYKHLLEASIDHRAHPILKALLTSADHLRESLKPTLPRAATLRPPPQLENGEAYYPMDARLSGADMPAHVRRIITSADLGAITEARRANFTRYARSAARLLPMHPITSHLTDAACPWVYPVLLENRSHWDHRLRDAGVALHTFGIYLHSSLFRHGDPLVIEDARFLAERMLCLSIHQDLSESDIDHSCEVIEGALSHAHQP